MRSAVPHAMAPRRFTAQRLRTRSHLHLMLGPVEQNSGSAVKSLLPRPLLTEPPPPIAHLAESAMSIYAPLVDGPAIPTLDQLSRGERKTVT